VKIKRKEKTNEKLKVVKLITCKYLVIDMDFRCWSFLYYCLFKRFGIDFANSIKPIFIKEREKKAYVRLIFEIPKNVKGVKIENRYVKKVEICLTKPEKINNEQITKITNIDDLRKIIRCINEISKLL